MAIAETIVLLQNPISGYERYHRSLIAARGDILDYQDDDRAMGGFWTASLKTRFGENQMYDFFERGLGREMRSYGYGSRTLHEGMVYEMELNLPPDRFTITLEGMFNEMLMRSDYDADGVVERSTTLTNDASVGRFGTKTRVLGGGQLDSLSVADQAVQTALNWSGFPQPSFSRGRGSGQPYLEIFSRGWIYMLAWELFNYTTPGTQGLSAQFVDVVTGSQYVAGIKYDANATIVSKVTDADRQKLDIIFDLAQLGDANNLRYLVYMTEGRIVNLAQAPPVSAVQ
jgi:hypothetical protein